MASLSIVAVVAACSGGGGGSGGRLSVPPTATASATFTTAPVLTASPTRTPTIASSATLTPMAMATATPPPSLTPTAIATCPAVMLPSATPPFSATPTHSPTRTASPRPTFTPTATPLIGPFITAVGIADGSGTFNPPSGTDAQGRTVFLRPTGAGFIIFVEARPGMSQLPVGTNVFSSRGGNPMGQPDLQIEASNSLGNGSAAVCDNSFPAVGGVPAVDPPDFSPAQNVSDALNDFGCRFKVFSSTDFACTQDSMSNFVFGNSSSTVQFCTLVSDALTFPSGDTVLTVRIRDTAGNAGPSSQIVVRVT